MQGDSGQTMVTPKMPPTGIAISPIVTSMAQEQLMNAIELRVMQEVQSLSSIPRLSAATLNSPLPGGRASGVRSSMQGAGWRA